MTIELLEDKYPSNALLALKQSLLLSVTRDLLSSLCSPTVTATLASLWQFGLQTADLLPQSLPQASLLPLSCETEEEIRGDIRPLDIMRNTNQF